MSVPEITIRGIDPSLKKAFKLYCIEHDTDMKDELIRIMTELVNKK